MIFNQKKLLDDVTNIITKKKLKHEIHRFDSGAFMIHIWYKGDFYVLQLTNVWAGFSSVREDPAFTSVPDETFFDNKSFMERFNSVFG